MFIIQKLVTIWVQPIVIRRSLNFCVDLLDYVVACDGIDEVENDHRNTIFEIDVHGKLVHFNFGRILSIIHLVGFMH